MEIHGALSFCTVEMVFFHQLCHLRLSASRIKRVSKKKEPFDVSLDQHDLPDWMEPLQGHKDNLTILQGLSGKMCTTGHHSWCSSLGVFKANERPSSIKWATVDFELAKLFLPPWSILSWLAFQQEEGMPEGA